MHPANLDGFIARFFAAFDNRQGRVPTRAEIDNLFLENAVILQHAKGETVVMTVAEFADPRLALRAPHEGSFEALKPLAMPFCGYVLSFLYVGIYWNNHHHMFHATKFVRGPVLWANLHLLFWLSLFPFVTDWMGESHWAALPTAAYGVVLLLAAIAYWILQQTIIREQGHASVLARAVGRDLKGKLSPFIYAAGIALAFWHAWMAAALYLFAALLWLVPDRRIERTLAETEST